LSEFAVDDSDSRRRGECRRGAAALRAAHAFARQRAESGNEKRRWLVFRSAWRSFGRHRRGIRNTEARMRNTEFFAKALRQTALGVAAAALTVAGFASTTQADSPPNSAPGAAPSAARVTGTWTILSATKNPRMGDKAEGTTYRFEDGGKVTVAGAKQCAYRFEGTDLLVDCDGTMMKGKVTFPNSETMVWTVAAGEQITLKKR
jgi:hypothetical protein